MDEKLTVSGLVLTTGGASLFVAGPSGMLGLGVLIIFIGIIRQSQETHSG